MSILCCRSPYLRRTLTSNKKNKDNALVHIKLPNISPEIFQIILNFQSNSLLQLQQFCTDFMVKSPEKIFKSLDFASLPEKSLIQLINRDDLQMKRLFTLSSKEFLQKVHPYKNFLKSKLYETLLNFHLDPDFDSTDNISLPRNPKIDGIIISKIVNNFDIISTISRQEAEMDLHHELCDDISHTVTFIKVKGTDEIFEDTIR
ncbi:unnamed protein product [Rhizophagus irregularis]|nr:unnamed protein product [Rhizophagus irregularis]